MEEWEQQRRELTRVHSTDNSNTIQIWCYENTKLMNTFPKILKVRSFSPFPLLSLLLPLTQRRNEQVLYSTDVLSDQAIIYWHAKGAKTQGKSHFLAATAPLVNFLKEQEESEEDDE